MKKLFFDDMRILLTGGSGQLGQAILASKPVHLGEESIELIAMTRSELDLSDEKSCQDAIEKHHPDWVLNAGAYTAVDQAESQPELAMAVNAKAPRAIAEALLQNGGNLLQLSTDFVFDGKQNTPYKTYQDRNPLSIYGKSKAIGEESVQNILSATDQGIILRTSWLVGPLGNNFVRTMLRLHRKFDLIKVVSDQIGGPTSSLRLAKICWRILELKQKKQAIPNILHWCDSGCTSWYDLAIAIGETAKDIGLISKMAKVKSINTIDYPTPAVRPKYSLLDCESSRSALLMESIHWRQSLVEILTVIASNKSLIK